MPGLYNPNGGYNVAAADSPANTADFWSFASAASGIVNSTTAVTVKTATVGLRNYLKTLQINSDTLGVATEVAIRDGAGGTVLWRGKLPTAALTPTTIVFNPPLRGSVATLLEVVTLTASVTGGVYINAQGFVAP